MHDGQVTIDDGIWGSKAVDAVRLGAIEIVLPTAGEPNCYIFHDSATLFGDDYNSEALDRFKAEWKKRRKRGPSLPTCVRQLPVRSLV